MRSLTTRFADWPEKMPYLQWGCGILLALACLPLHFYLSQHGGQAFDFWSLYSASHTLSEMPAGIYNTDISGARFHALITQAMPGWDGTESYIFIYPPLVALLIWPLHLLSYAQAYVLFGALSLFAAAWCSRLTAQMAKELGITRFAPLFASAIWFNLATLFTLLNGQISLLLCALFLSLLMAVQRQRWVMAALMLAVLVHTKPVLFAPLALYFFLRMPMRARTYYVGACVVIAALITLALGANIWMAYVNLVMDVGSTMGGFYSNIVDMVNLRGLLISVLGEGVFTPVTMLCNGLYIFTLGIGVPLITFYARRNVPLLIFALGAFFSPWCHYHDLIVLVPLGVFLLADLNEQKQSYKFVPLYFLVTLWSAFIPFAWGGRIALLCTIYLAAREFLASRTRA